MGAGTSEKNRQSSEFCLEILNSPNSAKQGNHMWKGKFEKKNASVRVPSEKLCLF
jgi:hypothetical protein